MDREQAWELLCEFTKSDSLRRHALAVEACVAAYAAKFGEDEQKWSVTALLHDFDYEMHPDAPDHPMKGEPILAERGVEREIRRAILSHANYSGVSRDSRLEKTLFACDELAGFLTACSLREAEPQHFRSRCQISPEKAQRQSVRALGQPGRYHERRAGTRGRPGSTYRILHRSDEGQRAGSLGFSWKLAFMAPMLESAWKLILAGAGPGLQNQRAAIASPVGSTPTSFRHH